MRKLHEITADLLAAITAAEEGAPIETPFIEAEAEEKLVGYYHAVHAIQGDLALADTTIKTAQEFKARKVKAEEWLENQIKTTLALLGKSKIDRPDCRITMVAGRELILRAAVDVLPKEFVITEEVKKGDWLKLEVAFKTALADAIKEAREIAEMEGADPDAAEAEAKREFAFHGCKVRTSEPSLRYPKIKPTTGEKE